MTKKFAWIVIAMAMLIGLTGFAMADAASEATGIDMDALLLVIYSAVGGAFFAVGGYLKSGETLDIVKVVVTAIIGIAIGLFLYISGIEITETNVIGYVVVLAGVVAIVTTWVKGLFTRLNILQGVRW